MCDQCREREAKDRRMWQVISRLLKGIAHAIDERYPEIRDTSHRIQSANGKSPGG